jgi:hypothetical protein
MFFVYIIESPSPVDMYHGRSEGHLLADALSLDGIKSVVHVAISLDAFVAALRIGLPEAMQQFPGQHFILHLSSHGGSEGLQLSSQATVPWRDLRTLLIPINQVLKGGLLLSISACEGYQGCRMAMQQDNAPHPYHAMVANYGAPTWSDTAVAYLSFYHLLSKGKTIHDAVDGMKAASGDAKWVVESAEEARQGYLEFLKTQTEPVVAQQQLQDIARQEDVPPGAKAFEHLGG